MIFLFWMFILLFTAIILSSYERTPRRRLYRLETANLLLVIWQSLALINLLIWKGNSLIKLIQIQTNTLSECILTPVDNISKGRRLLQFKTNPSVKVYSANLDLNMLLLLIFLDFAILYYFIFNTDWAFKA